MRFTPGSKTKTAVGFPAAHIRGHDGIGRHARFRCRHLSGEVFVKIAARFLLLIYAGMMKLVNMLDLGSSAARLVGSSPTTRTNLISLILRIPPQFPGLKGS